MPTLLRLFPLALVVMSVMTLSCAFVSSAPFSFTAPANKNGIQRRRYHRRTPRVVAAALQDSDDQQPFIPRPGERPPPQGGNMAYVKPNIDRQMQQYTQIRNVGGVECVADVYARTPKQPNVYWFAGKVARCTGTVSLEQAINRQWNLLEEHVVRLRPVELGRSFGSVEFWTAPGDSELDCANNMVELQPVNKNDRSSNEVSVKEVGCNLEVVTNKGVGFFVERGEDGSIL